MYFLFQEGKNVGIEDKVITSWKTLWALRLWVSMEKMYPPMLFTMKFSLK